MPILTYLITTRNKLSFLKEVLKRLLIAVQPDEEIVIIDGASTDGTVEYLQGLYDAGLIHQYISEPDKGEAHGWNKGLLTARGNLIKIMTDDDAYYYPAIRVCRDFMLNHPEIDILTTEAAGFSDIENPESITVFNFRHEFIKWLKKRQAIWLPGPGIMIRRKSIPLIGLFQPGFIGVDTEFSPRATAGPANWAFFTGFSYFGMPNIRSNQINYSLKLSEEIKRLIQFYQEREYTIFDKIIRTILSTPKNCERFVRKKIINRLKSDNQHNANLDEAFLSQRFDFADHWLLKNNQEKNCEFLYLEMPEL